MAMQVFLADSWMELSLISISRIHIYELFIRYVYILYFSHSVCIIRYKFIAFVELNKKMYLINVVLQINPVKIMSKFI